MNDIHRFLQIPLWAFLLIRLVAKPAGVIETDELAEYRKMYTMVLRSIRLIGRTNLEAWLLRKLVAWIEREIKALSELEMQDVVVVVREEGVA